MSKKSNVDVAYDIIASNSTPVDFASLWAKVVEIQEISEDDAKTKVGPFYTSILLDGRFLNVGENTWALRSRYSSKDAEAFLEVCYAEDDEEQDDVDPEEKEEFDGEEDDDSEESESDYDEE